MTRIAQLTARELQVLDGRARGLSVKQVAAELGLSYHTARHHLEHIHRKTRCHSTIEALGKLGAIALVSNR